jgi:hypothetical protein
MRHLRRQVPLVSRLAGGLISNPFQPPAPCPRLATQQGKASFALPLHASSCSVRSASGPAPHAGLPGGRARVRASMAPMLSRSRTASTARSADADSHTACHWAAVAEVSATNSSVAQQMHMLTRCCGMCGQLRGCCRCACLCPQMQFYADCYRLTCQLSSCCMSCNC